MFDLPGHHDLLNVFALADRDQFTEFAERHPVTALSGALDILRCFFLDGDGDCLVALLSGGFESYHGEAPVTGNNAVLHPLITPRCEAEMNASNSATWGHGSTSACIRSIAWLVFNPARVSRRNAVCNDSIAALSNPRRASPTLFAPK